MTDHYREKEQCALYKPMKTVAQEQGLESVLRSYQAECMMCPDGKPLKGECKIYYAKSRMGDLR